MTWTPPAPPPGHPADLTNGHANAHPNRRPPAPKAVTSSGLAPSLYEQEYNVDGGLQRAVVSQGTIRIVPVGGTGELRLEVSADSSVADLLQQIAAQLGTNPIYHAHDLADARLLWRGRALKDERTLGSYGLPSEGEPLRWHPRVKSQRGRLRPLNSTARGLLMTVSNAPFDPARLRSYPGMILPDHEPHNPNRPLPGPHQGPLPETAMAGLHKTHPVIVGPPYDLLLHTPRQHREVRLEVGSMQQHKGIAKAILDPPGGWISGGCAGSRALEPGDAPSTIEIRYRR